MNQESVAIKDWRSVADTIINNRHLKAFLKANKAADRLQIFKALEQHLHFKPKPFFLLNS